MISLSRVKEATKEFIKVLRYGRKDILTPAQYLPYGIDSKPVKESLALFMDTSNSEDYAVVGYSLKSDKTNPGETMIYSTDSEGNDQFYIKLTDSGKCIIGGETDNAVRYSGLNTDLQLFLIELNANLSASFSSVGGAWTPVTLDISNSKVDKVNIL